QASGVVMQSYTPLARPQTIFSYIKSDSKKISDLIEEILTSQEIGSVIITNQLGPIPRPEILTMNRMDYFDENNEHIESKLLDILESEDLNRSFSILVGSYFTDFNAKKDLARL